MSVKIGSLFAGIGGFELGLERAIPGAETIWQVEQDAFCQSILKKHWPHAQIFDDVCAVGAHNLPPVDILCGGFPCQNISNGGKKEGIYGEKSSLWFEMRRIISELRPPIIILENVAAITFRGLPQVLGDLAALRYDAEWCIISARDFGAPHLRERWFCVAYTNGDRLRLQSITRSKRHKALLFTIYGKNGTIEEFTDASGARGETGISTPRPTQEEPTTEFNDNNYRRAWRPRKSYWSTQPRVCGVVDGVPNRTHRLRVLGNAIVPQCSQWIGEQVYMSGLLNNQVYLEPREDFDACIVAVRHVVIYSGDMIIEMLMKRYSWSHIDALDYFCFNIEPSQADHWPQFVWDE